MQAKNQTIKAAANRAARTFTLRIYFNGKYAYKYRTIPLPKQEFEDCLYNTENDWKQFLKTSDYYKV